MRQLVEISVEDSTTGRRFERRFDELPIRIGSAANADLVLQGDGVATFHGTIDEAGGRLRYTHHDAFSETRVGTQTARPRTPTDLLPGDVITIGSLRLAVALAGPVEEPAGSVATGGTFTEQESPERSGSAAASDAALAIPVMRATAETSPADTNPGRGPGAGADGPAAPAPQPAIAADQAIAALVPGSRLGRYELLRLVGEGGMGKVFAAHDPEFAADVAIKTLSAALATQPRQLARFKQEAQAARRIDHPNVVKVFERGVVAGIPYIAMELLSGEPLSARIRRGPLSPTEMANILLPVIEGVALAHNEKIIHRDLKPANIFLVRQGGLTVPKVLDFGVSRMEGARITQEGALLGTLHYLAPEQALDSREVDERADQYALGAIMYACMTGRPPHEGGNQLAVIRNIVRGEIRRPRELRPDLPADLENVILRAMKREPAERYSSVYEMGLAFIEHASRAHQLNYLKFQARLSAASIASPNAEVPVPPTIAPRQDAAADSALAPTPRDGAADPLVGSTIGNHRIVSRIGEGGMGAVYLADHSLLRRNAAIKVLLPQFSGNPEAVRRFINEARATAQLRHPAFVEVFDSGTLPDGSVYLVMEYLQGETLGAYLRRVGRLAVAEAVQLVRQIAQGVAYAHEHGIVHRDLKPDNVFLVRAKDRAGTTTVKVLDFGIAKLATSDLAEGTRTRSGAVVGTPLYMAPEQCRGATKTPIDHRADLYALGCMLHAMLAGEPPFPYEGFGDIISAHIGEAPKPLRTIDANVPRAIETLVLRLLAKQPDDRPESMVAVLAELDELQIANTSIAQVHDPSTTAGAAAPASAGVVVAGGTKKLPPAASGAISTFRGVAAEAATSEQTANQRRRRFVTLLAVGGLAVVAAGALVWRPLLNPATVPGNTSSTVTEEVHVPPQARAPQSPTRPSGHSASAAPPAKSAPEPPSLPSPPAAPVSPVAQPVRAPIMVTISSQPSGAEVVDPKEGRVLGTTPFRETVGSYGDSAKTAHLIVRKKGFRQKDLHFDLDRDQQLTVRLERSTAPSTPGMKPPGAPETPPSGNRPPPETDHDDDWRKL